MALKVRQSTAKNFDVKPVNEGDELKPSPILLPEYPEKGIKITPELYQSLLKKPLEEMTEEEGRMFVWITDNIIRKEQPLMFYQPNVTAEQFHACQSPYRLLVGGNRSGKTYSGSAEAAYFALCQHPYKPDLQPNEGWVVSETYKVQEEASQKLIMEKLPPNQISKIVLLKGGVYESIHVDVVKNGKKIGTSKIGFKSSDSGPRNFAGAAKRWIWFDEEPPIEIYKECIARIAAGMPLDIFFTMTPSSNRGVSLAKGYVVGVPRAVSEARW